MLSGKKKARRLGIYAGFTIASLFASSTARAAVTTYPDSPLPNRTDYTVSADGTSIRVENVQMTDTTGANADKPVAGFAFDGSVRVTVTPNFSFSYALVHPTQYGYEVSRSGNSVSFTIPSNNKGKVVVEFDNDYNKSLFLFADPPVPAIPSGARVYNAGAHSGHIWVGNGETVYLAPGAVVTGDINMKDISNAKVIGRGWYLGSLWVERTTNCEINGIHGARLGKWTVNLLDSTGFKINHMKLMYQGGETDGFSYNNTGNSSTRNSFVMNADDVFTSQKPGCKDNLTENIVVWSNQGGNIFGPGGTEDIGGNNVYRNIYIVRGKNNFLTHHWSNGPKNIAGYTFENIFCDPRVPFSSFIYFNGITNVGTRYYTLRNVYSPYAPSRIDASNCKFTFTHVLLNGNRVGSTGEMGLNNLGSGNTFTFGLLSNLLSNGSFEAEQYSTQTPSGWSEWSDQGGVSTGKTEKTNTGGAGASFQGSYHGVHWNANAYRMYTYQTKTGLANGLYTLSAMTKSSGGQSHAVMDAKDYGGSLLVQHIIPSSNWRQIVIPNINVTNGQCTVGFWSISPADKWIAFDRVELIKQ